MIRGWIMVAQLTVAALVVTGCVLLSSWLVCAIETAQAEEFCLVVGCSS
jgi:hypothetical protein